MGKGEGQNFDVNGRAKRWKVKKWQGMKVLEGVEEEEEKEKRCA